MPWIRLVAQLPSPTMAMLQVFSLMNPNIRATGAVTCTERRVDRLSGGGEPIKCAAGCLRWWCGRIARCGVLAVSIYHVVHAH